METGLLRDYFWNFSTPGENIIFTWGKAHDVRLNPCEVRLKRTSKQTSQPGGTPIPAARWWGGVDWGWSDSGARLGARWGQPKGGPRQGARWEQGLDGRARGGTRWKQGPDGGGARWEWDQMEFRDGARWEQVVAKQIDTKQKK